MQFPVSIDVKKYLVIHIGGNYRLSEADHFGLFLFAMLQRQKTHVKYNKRLLLFSQKFSITVPGHLYFYSSCRHFTSRTIYKFNEFVEKLILAEAHAYIDLRSSQGKRWQRDAIYEFMDKYGFEADDMNFDRIKKSYQRYLRKSPPKKEFA